MHHIRAYAGDIQIPFETELELILRLDSVQRLVYPFARRGRLISEISVDGIVRKQIVIPLNCNREFIIHSWGCSNLPGNVPNAGWVRRNLRLTPLQNQFHSLKAPR